MHSEVVEEVRAVVVADSVHRRQAVVVADSALHRQVVAVVAPSRQVLHVRRVSALRVAHQAIPAVIPIPVHHVLRQRVVATLALLRQAAARRCVVTTVLVVALPWEHPQAVLQVVSIVPRLRVVTRA